MQQIGLALFLVAQELVGNRAKAKEVRFLSHHVEEPTVAYFGQNLVWDIG